VVLKVISGIARGRILKTLPISDLSMRPMFGRMKKSVFDIIKFKVPCSTFVDLFAGVGSVGIEALSRGAEKAIFIELNDIFLSLIKHNLDVLGFCDRAKIIKCDITKNFAILQNRKYDIIFIGPPYKDKNKRMLTLTHNVLKDSVKYDILKKDSIVITQRHIKESVDNVPGLGCFRSEKYGDTLVSFYERVM
jgi:16S rRNA (guanine(966)-N(2))-methyltransferase RsmD